MNHFGKGVTADLHESFRDSLDICRGIKLVFGWSEGADIGIMFITLCSAADPSKEESSVLVVFPFFLFQHRA